MTVTYKVDSDDVRIASWVADDVILVRVKTDGLNEQEIVDLISSVQTQMEEQFPNNKIVAHSDKVEFFTVHAGSKLPRGSKHIVLPRI